MRLKPWHDVPGYLAKAAKRLWPAHQHYKASQRGGSGGWLRRADLCRLNAELAIKQAERLSFFKNNF
jgi:hypothetical protein